MLTTGTSTLQVDSRMNKLVISDLPEKMALVKDVISAFDEPTPQVFIEAEIVQVSLSDKYEYGIAWERLFNEGRFHGFNISSKFYGSFPLSNASTFGSTKQGQVSIGTLTNDSYSAIMQFLQTIGKTNVLSRPRIAALNNEEAKILIGTREAFTTGTLSQAESTTVTSESIEFVDVGVKLNVVPTITHDDFIIMKIKPEVSIVKEYLTTSVLQSRVPIVETSEIETIVKVKDGSMILIGGLIKKEKTYAHQGIPVLADLPWIGALFHSKKDEWKKTELIIFLRPRIITGESTRLVKEDTVEVDKDISITRSLKGFQR